MTRLAVPLVAGILLLAPLSGANAFEKGGCGGGACADCHKFTKEEAAKVLGGMVDKVLSVEMSPVGGLWTVGIEKDGNRWPVYVDFSKKFLINGQVIRLSTKENVTDTQATEMSRVDVSAIPVDNAIVVGNPGAATRIIVFSDPDCHFCGMLHKEIKKIVSERHDIVFLVKLYSRVNNATTTRKALSVICSGSEKLLDDAYAGKALPDPTCETPVVAETFRLAGTLGIRGTPTMILPDGRVVRGYRDANAILTLLEAGKKGAGGAAQ
ncbi:MAG: DsbC family protein [Gemmatimonadota bacterium]